MYGRSDYRSSRRRIVWRPNNSMEPPWLAGSRCQRLLIDSGLPAGVSFLVARSYEQPATPRLLVSAQAALPPPARGLISRPVVPPPTGGALSPPPPPPAPPPPPGGVAPPEKRGRGQKTTRGTPPGLPGPVAN